MLGAERDPAALREEVMSMRERLREAHACPPDEFDVKHSAGGMIDVEFAVQYLVLAHSRHHPGLLDNKGNIALLDRAEQAGLLPEGVGHAAGHAYRELRRIQHRARLDDATTRLAGAQLQGIAPLKEAVLRLWSAVFSEATG